jgi:hypothetical protein
MFLAIVKVLYSRIVYAISNMLMIIAPLALYNIAIVCLSMAPRDTAIAHAAHPGLNSMYLLCRCLLLTVIGRSTATTAPTTFLGIFIAFFVSKWTVRFVTSKFLVNGELFLAATFFILALGLKGLQEAEKGGTHLLKHGVLLLTVGASGVLH